MSVDRVMFGMVHSIGACVRQSSPYVSTQLQPCTTALWADTWPVGVSSCVQSDPLSEYTALSAVHSRLTRKRPANIRSSAQLALCDSIQHVRR